MRQLSCDEHVLYRAGCDECQRRGRRYERKRAALARQGTALSTGAAVSAAHIRQLRAAGYSLPYLAAHTNLGVATLNRICNGRVDWVQLRVFLAIERVYGELRALPGPSPQVAAKARKRGWTPPPPLPMPDDIGEDIVDPIAVERAADGDKVCLTRAEKVAAWDLLVQRGYSEQQRIDLLHVGAASIKRWRGGYQRKQHSRRTA